MAELGRRFKIMTIVGARPQFVKVAPVSRQFAKSAAIEEILVHTGQHYDEAMSASFFERLELPTPKYDLGVGSHSHGAQTGRMLEKIEEVLLKEEPALVLVYGDTNSTLAGALAAAKLHVPVAHVEAGLRSFNRAMPEEVNRVLADQLSDLLFAPTELAVKNLRSEGVTSNRIHNVGDVMFDAVNLFAHRADVGDLLKANGLTEGKFVLATIHRAENTDDTQRLAVIFGALEQVSRHLPVLLPMHPRTRARMGELAKSSGVRITGPASYFEMLGLERAASVVVTDSGGVQKEAFFAGRPCVTLRDETEWMELVDLGWNRVVPPVDTASIVDAVLSSVGQRGNPGAPYGDGQAAARIAKTILSSFAAK